MSARGVLARHGPALLVAISPALLWLAPILRDPAHTILGAEGDNLYYVRQFWWMKHALFDLHRSPFFDPTSYVPDGYAVVRGELTPANTVPALPVTLIAGPIVAYNLMMVLSFVLTAWAVYAWVFRLSESRAGALTAAIVASMAPYRLCHAIGHVPLAATQGFAFTLWTFEELLRCTRSRDSTRLAWALALGLSATMTAWSSWYYAFSLALLFPLYVVLRTLRRGELWRSAAWWRSILLAAAVAAALVAPFAARYAGASIGGALRRSFAETDTWSVNVYDFVIPNPRHPLWSGWLTSVFPREEVESVERTVSLGYVALALAVFGYVRGRRERIESHAALAGVAIVSALFALGPLLHYGDRDVLLPAPYAVTKTVDWLFHRVRPGSPYRELFWKLQVVPIPLPALVLFVFVPGAAAMRVFARFGYLTMLMTAALAGFGARELLAARIRSSPTARAAALGAILVAVVFESWTVKDVSRWEPRPVDAWIAGQPPGDVVVELPFVAAFRPAQDYYATIQQHPSILGPLGDSFYSPAVGERRATIAELPSARGFATLRFWGTTLCIVQTDRIDDWTAGQEALASPGTVEAARFGATRVYRFR